MDIQLLNFPTLTKENQTMSGVEQWAISPCQNYKNRKLGCHGECKKYSEFKAKIEERKKIYKKINHFIPLLKIEKGEPCKKSQWKNAQKLSHQQCINSEQVANQLSITRTRYSQIENNRRWGCRQEQYAK